MTMNTGFLWYICSYYVHNTYLSYLFLLESEQPLARGLMITHSPWKPREVLHSSEFKVCMFALFPWNARNCKCEDMYAELQLIKPWDEIHHTVQYFEHSLESYRAIFGIFWAAEK